MSVTTVCATPSITAKLVVLMLVAYLPALLTISIRRRGRRTLASAVVPVVLMPLFLGLGGTLLMLARVVQADAISGGGRASRAAGVAEAFVLLVFAMVVAALASAIACAHEVIARSRGKQPDDSGTHHRGFQITTLSIAGLFLVGTFASGWTAQHGTAGLVMFRVLLFAGCLGGGAALTITAWLALVIRRDIALQNREVVATVAALVLSGSAALCTWQYVQHLTRIAIGG